ncbi:outer membrane lipoprotein carrier protein LolA [Kitasatospora sp. NPDC052896]|uniref:outer membrane lipoprotein carrier protein LolA n=1 Tax=Kitasatospora sp. NPDC052896 TaxID=3364061 RepID=UPI0037C73F35
MTRYAGFEEFEDAETGQVFHARRRTAVRVLVPVAIAAVAATGIGLVPALADSGAPALPQLTAQQLVAKALGGGAQQLSGTVQVSADLGIPAELLDAAGHGGAAAAVTGTAGAAGGSGQAQQGDNAAAASPESRLTTLLAGDHTLRVSADGPDRQRVALVEDLAEYDLIHNGDQLWAWDSASDQAVHLTAPQDHTARDHRPQLPTDLPTTPAQAAQQLLAGSASTSTVTVAGTTTVAGRSAYQLSVKPRQAGSTIGEVRIAVDAANGTPLAVVATSTGGSTVLDVHFSDVSFTAPAASTFTFTPPKGAKVTEQPAGPEKPRTGGKAGTGEHGVSVTGTGWTTVLSLQLPTDQATEAAGGNDRAGRAKGRHQGVPSTSALVKSFGKPVDGGTLISTNVVNVLITNDDHVYAGAVTLPVLQAAAGVK